MKRVELDGDAVVLRTVIAGIYHDVVYVRDDTQSVGNDCWVQLPDYKALVALELAKETAPVRSVPLPHWTPQSRDALLRKFHDDWGY